MNLQPVFFGPTIHGDDVAMAGPIVLVRYILNSRAKAVWLEVLPGSPWIV